MKIKIKKLISEAVIPKIATKEAACSDVVATEIIINKNVAIVKLGFSTEIPKGYKMCMSPRSSFTGKGWIMQNSPGQIDSDYRGEWMIKFEAIPIIDFAEQGDGIVSMGSDLAAHYTMFPYEKGDRVAQIWLEKIEFFEFEETTELVETDRNNGGFGSTGR